MELEELQNEIKQNDALMVYFSGENCGVCRVLRPKVKEMMEEKFPKIKQIYISADEYKQTSANFNVFCVPTLMIFLDGKEFIKKSRNISISELENELSRPYSMYFD